MENALFETHAHLDTFEDKELLKNVIEDSKNAGIKKFVVPAISAESNFYIRDLFYKRRIYRKDISKQSDYIQNVRLMSLGTKIKRRNLKGF